VFVGSFAGRIGGLIESRVPLICSAAPAPI
jgi:hypothetical protein